MTSKVTVDAVSNASQLILEIAGATAATVNSAGLTVTNQLLASTGSIGAPGLSFSAAPTYGIRYNAGNGLDFSIAGAFGGRIDTSGNYVCPGALILSGNQDVQLHRDDAGALALRNGANAQNLRVYGMFTDAINYGRVEVGSLGTIDGASTRYGVIARSSGTGSVTNIDFGTMDPGSIGFVTSGLHRWYIDPSGHYKAIDDNTYDIGASGAERPRDLYVARDVVVGDDVTISGDLSVSGTVNFLPAGVIMPYAGTSEPTGYLFCYGQAVSRTTYATLFTAISTTYGAGDGSTTFNLPDLRGRVVAGQDDMGGSSANRLTNQTGGLDGDTLGATGGAETHTLTTAQMPAHTHTFQAYNDVGGTNGPRGADATPSGTGTTASTGGGGAHNNVQPTIILNYIIKT